ncbi:hypothetical protein DJ73_06115 [Halorubrum sp. Ea1]|nr:hypothetical protein DJ73_06115 [Halorubrum sp. Ea1]
MNRIQITAGRILDILEILIKPHCYPVDLRCETCKLTGELPCTLGIPLGDSLLVLRISTIKLFTQLDELSRVILHGGERLGRIFLPRLASDRHILAENLVVLITNE